jgi:Asp/Glu/hydantoin racemase
MNTGAQATQPGADLVSEFCRSCRGAPLYIARLEEFLTRYADLDVRFHVHGIFPPDRYLNPLTEFRCAAQTIRNAIQAEEQGYDAFAIGHFQEPGLIECRTAVEIPVIGLGEATMLYACTLGRTFGLVTINPVFTLGIAIKSPASV